jgi:hypothetical protein
MVPNTNVNMMKSLNKSSEDLITELQWEEKIKSALSESILYFEYEETEEKTVLHIITISKNHGERFLFHRVTSHTNSRIRCLEDMWTYIEEYKKSMEHYHIQWMKKGESSQSSWFYGRTFLEVVDKFFYGKDPSNVKILEMKLMPLS